MDALKPNTDAAYHIRTVLGFGIITLGIGLGLWLGWWFIFKGDIVQIIHQLKLNLPSWGWQTLKYGLSVVFGAAFIGVFAFVGALVLSGGKRE